jgi:hypothetical protein
MTGFLGRFDDFLASLGGRFWVWVGVFTFIFIYGLVNQSNILDWPSKDVWLRTVDSDVYIRLTKVRELIQGGSLYNHEVTATNAPYGGITTPWTHPLDFILIFLYQFTPSDFSIEKRLLLVSNWYPLLIISCIIFCLVRAAETGFKSIQKLAIVSLCLVTDLIFSDHSYFMAGNADHHSIQALIWCLSIWLMLGKPSISSAFGLGLSMGVWFWISPEALPFICTAYAVLGARVILKPTEAYYPTLTSLTLTLTTFLALFVEYPAEQVLATRAYDSLSIIYVTLFSFCATGFLILQYVIARQPHIKLRFIFSALTAAVISLLYITLFPKLLKGPLVDADPYILKNFLPRISEATPLWKLDGEYILSSLYLTIPALLLSLRFIKKYPMIFVFLVPPFVMTTFQTRWSYYLEISSIIGIAKLLPLYARMLSLKYRPYKILLHPYILMVAICVMTYGVSSALPPSKNTPYVYIDKCQIEGFQLTQSGGLVHTLGETPLTIESNILGNSGISFFTPYRYIAGYYHREGKGLQVKDAIIDSKNLETVRTLLKERNVKALLICPTAHPSWANDYFADKPPQLNWVKINNQLQFRENSGIKTHPILLNIEP